MCPPNFSLDSYPLVALETIKKTEKNPFEPPKQCIKGRSPSTEENGFFLLSARFVIELFPKGWPKKRYVRSAINSPQYLENLSIFSHLHQLTKA